MRKITVTGFVNAAARPRAKAVKRAPAKRAPAKRAPKRVYQVYQNHGKSSVCIASCADMHAAYGIAEQLNRVAKSGVKFDVR